MNSQGKGKFEGRYSQRVLTPAEVQAYETQVRLDNGDFGLADIGIDYNRPEPQGRPPSPPSRSQWAPVALSPSSVLKGSLEPGALTGGPNPIYYTGRSADPYKGDDGKRYPGEDNIFPPNRQGDLPLRFAPMPVGLNQIDKTPQHIQEAALEAFRTNPYPYSPPSFAPVSPVYPSSPIYPPERYAAAAAAAATAAANQDVVSSIGDWLGSMGKGGKTRKNKRKGKRKTIRKMKSKKSKKSKKSRRL